MGFGWYHELLQEYCVPDLAAAETEVFRMLDDGGMIVHVYRHDNQDSPELVGRHSRLRSFIAPEEHEAWSKGGSFPHEVERFLLDAESVSLWREARESGALLDQRWSVAELWGDGLGPFYGKAVLCRPMQICPSPAIERIDMVRRRL